MAITPTPTNTIARTLKAFGLIQGKDFIVRGHYSRAGGERMRIGTDALIRSQAAEQIVADHANAIEQVSAEVGHPFLVSVHYHKDGTPWVWIDNYSIRVREDKPGQDKPGQDKPNQSSQAHADDYAIEMAELADNGRPPRTTYELTASAAKKYPRGQRVACPKMGNVKGTVNGREYGRDELGTYASVTFDHQPSGRGLRVYTRELTRLGPGE